jgi:uncharacterized protein YndB with AHSA1/START domain
MAAGKPKSPPVVQVTRRFAAPREKVFQAFLDPKAVTRWFAPSPLRWIAPPEIDPREGGRYSFRVEDDGKRWHIHGVYREVRPPERLVFTWLWEDDPVRHETGDTLVTILFRERGRGTEVALTHEQLPSAASRRDHTDGWARCLDDIAGILRGAVPRRQKRLDFTRPK